MATLRFKQSFQLQISQPACSINFLIKFKTKKESKMKIILGPKLPVNQ